MTVTVLYEVCKCIKLELSSYFMRTLHVLYEDYMYCIRTAHVLYEDCNLLYEDFLLFYEDCTRILCGLYTDFTRTAHLL